MKQRYVMLAAALGLLLTWAMVPTKVQAQDGGFMECSACQIILDLSASSAPVGATNIEVDTKPCALLTAGDQKACTQFFTAYSPKFIRAIQERRAKGESYHQMCARMGYCQ